MGDFLWVEDGEYNMESSDFQENVKLIILGAGLFTYLFYILPQWEQFDTEGVLYTAFWFVWLWIAGSLLAPMVEVVFPFFEWVFMGLLSIWV